jgi:hypothetical protein
MVWYGTRYHAEDEMFTIHKPTTGTATGTATDGQTTEVRGGWWYVVWYGTRTLHYSYLGILFILKDF